MRRLGTAGLWLLLLCGLACGDRVIVARGLSLVSAAQSSDDAGFAEAEPEPGDAGVDAADGGVIKPPTGHGNPGRRPPPPPARADGQGDPHDKTGEVDETVEPLAGDAGHDDSDPKHH